MNHQNTLHFFCIFLFLLMTNFSINNSKASTHKTIDSLECNTAIQQLFNAKQITFPTKNLYLRIFKTEKIVELYASNTIEYVLIKKYKFTATSGILGPKIKEGDLQIPEGFYKIDAFNPASKFHLSFRINYPNKSDSVRNKSIQKLGGDIYVHGGKSTVGCIPIGNKNIEELFQICLQCYLLNSEIPVHIFPFKMDKDKLSAMENKFPVNHINWTFWNSLQPMYQFFESHRMLGEITDIDAKGNYILSIPWD